MGHPDQTTGKRDATHHVVLKRGHRGRYRFTVMTEDATISGHVQVDPAVTDRQQADQLVRRRILELTGFLALWADGGEGVTAGPVPEAVSERT